MLSACTLAPASESQTIDGITEQTEKRYMHHYNFPGYSVGEARPMRSPGRREIGHGALAERAPPPVLPSVEEFPLRNPRGIRSFILQRFYFHGFHLRLLSGSDGRRRSNQETGCRYRNGSD